MKEQSKDNDPPQIVEPPHDNLSQNKNNGTDLSERQFVLKNFTNKLPKILRFKFKSNNTLEEEVAELIQEHDPEGTQVSSEERVMLHNILGIGDMKVSDVMIPRSDIIALDENINLDELREFIMEKEHTRIPVFRSSLDNVVGFIHIKDLFHYLGKRNKFAISDVLREILYVPPSMRIIDLLFKMKAKRVHMAIVVDEYGGTDGLVTMEDLMEEIVGEIEDEHDRAEEFSVKRLDDYSFEVNARIPIEEVENKLNIKLVDSDNKGDFDTLGGLIFFMLGRIPDQGEIVSHTRGIDFEIKEADLRRIKKIIIRQHKQ